MKDFGGIDVSTGVLKTDSNNHNLTALGVAFDKWWKERGQNDFTPKEISAYFRDKKKITIHYKTRYSFDTVTFKRDKNKSIYEELLGLAESECDAEMIKFWVKRLLACFHIYMKIGE